MIDGPKQVAAEAVASIPTSMPAAASPALSLDVAPRIKTLSLCDFRAFAGPAPVSIELGGKNLLVYGENGAGKSSIFHALNEFFSVALAGKAARKDRLLALEHIFPTATKGKVAVEVTFVGDQAPVRWDENGHPADLAGYPSKPADARVTNAAYRKAVLDYRSLLDTNYGHRDAVNLFTVCVEVLLRDYPVSHGGKEERLFDLWRRLEWRPRMDRMTSADISETNAIVASLNTGTAEALDNLPSKTNEILSDLRWGDVKLERFEFSSVRFVWDRLRRNRKLVGTNIRPVLSFHGTELPRPQAFLNEARLSALALAVYFAGRELCAATLQTDTPRVMVLDDVLIGLDQSNRLPVLDVIEHRFTDWQVVLLTHDRVWYEMARFRLEDDDKWKSLELFEALDPSGFGHPMLRPQSSEQIASNIAKARNFHRDGEFPAAAVHARVAFELSLKKVCDARGIPVRFHLEQRHTTTEDLLTAVEEWLKKPNLAGARAVLSVPISELKLWRRVVLNPFSHSTPVNLAPSEVLGAINAVEALHNAFKDQLLTRGSTQAAQAEPEQAAAS